MPLLSFKDLTAWQKAGELSLSIYKAFANCKDYGFRDQLQRASLSIMNNIVEGYARRSDKSLRNFLLIAKGSAAEVESMLLIAVNLGYLSKEKQTELNKQIEEIGRLLSGFIKKL